MSSLFGSPSRSEQNSVSNSANIGVNQSVNGANSVSQNSSANNSYNNSTSNSSNTSNSNSSSGNQAFDSLLKGLSPQISNGTTASSSLGSLLGIGGDPAAQQQAFKNWQNSTGYQFGLDQGTQAITQNNAAKGLLNSGATAKALDTYGQNYANTQFQNYVNPLMSLIGSGNQAAGVLSGAGGVSNSASNSNGVSTSNSNGASTGASNGSSASNSFGNSNGFTAGNSNSVSNGTSYGATPGIGGFLGSILGAVGTGK